MGGTFDHADLLARPHQGYGNGIMVWKMDVEAVNDLTKGEGRLYIPGESNSVSPHTLHTFAELCNYSFSLRDVANDLQVRVNEEDATAFYNVHYLIPTAQDSVGFDPYRIDPGEVQEAGGKEQMLRSFEIVLSRGEACGAVGWGRGLRDYLTELLEHLQEWDENS